MQATIEHACVHHGFALMALALAGVSELLNASDLGMFGALTNVPDDMNTVEHSEHVGSNLKVNLAWILKNAMWALGWRW